MTTRLRTTRAKLAHYTRQALRPIGGPEGFAIFGDALNENFFGGVGRHAW